MWSLTRGCFGLTATKEEIPWIVEWIESWLSWNNTEVTKDQVLSAMNSLIRWVGGDTRWLPRTDNPSFIWVIESNLRGVKSLLFEDV